MNIKAGNGINDDTQYIQGLLDSGRRHIYLPEPERFYLISKPLKIPSDTALVLDRFTGNQACAKQQLYNAGKFGHSKRE